MPRTKFSLASTFVFATIVSITMMAGTLARAQSDRMLQAFKGATITNGNGYPNGNLIMDAAGNFYGTTAALGNSCSGAACGTVFELSPTGTGGYTQKLLHVFSMSGLRPWNPQAGLAMDASGNLYGTTLAGGLDDAGTVFKLTFAGGVWNEILLHSFGATGDGASPQVGVILDAAGNIYGTAPTGGHGAGVVYEISPKAGGGWTYQLLHSFRGPDGAMPGQLIMDPAGNLYGTTFGGGTGQGTVFKLAPVSGSPWIETVLYNFPAGGEPFPYLAMDAAGNLYGTAAGGTGDGGVAFELSPSGGSWTESVIYDFCAVKGCPAGGTPIGLVLDAAGNLYGVSSAAGAQQAGTATELLAPAAGRSWTAKLLHTFGNGFDGAEPQGLLLYSGGTVYGSTLLGGKYGYGTVFQITP